MNAILALAVSVVLGYHATSNAPQVIGGQRASIYLIGGAATESCPPATQYGDQYWLVGDTTTGITDGQRTPLYVSETADKWGKYVNVHPIDGMLDAGNCYLPGWWTGGIPSAAQPVVQPYLRVQHEAIMGWALGTLLPPLGVDLTRVSLRGSSMGGTGALLIGMAHPERYAVVWASVPSLETASVADFSRNGIYPAPANTLMADTGMLYTDYMDAVAYAADTSHPLPPILLDGGQADSFFAHFADFVRAVQGRDDTLLVAAWTSSGHGETGGATRILATLNLGSFSTQGGYPLLTESTADAPDFSPLPAGAVAGINLDIGFDQVLDSSTSWSVRLWTTNPAGLCVNVRPGGAYRKYQVLEQRKNVCLAPPVKGVAQKVTVSFGGDLYR